MASPEFETETDGAVNEPARQPRSRSYPRRDDDFRETLAAPIPNRTYRSEIEDFEHPSALEQLVRYVAVLLDVLLAIRFVISLFTTNTTNSFVAFIYGLTNWLVAPFQALFGHAPANATGGYFDWAALAAMVVVSVLAALIIRLLQGPKEEY
jgi:uncharacterized protein YggT (Ycf19 family)